MKRILAALLCASAGGASAGQEPPRFAARTDVVSVDVVATLDGRVIEGLTAADFEVRDNGVVQVLDHVSAGTAPVDALLVLDTSASVAGEMLARLQASAAAFVAGLEPRDRVALLRFNQALSRIGPSASDVRAALAAATAGGATALHDAVYAALAVADPHAGRPVVLVFTDGVDVVSWLPPASVLEAARRSEAVVYVVDGSGRECRPQEPGTWMSRGRAPTRSFLAELAADTGGLCWSSQAQGLPAAFDDVLRELRSRYLLRYEPRGVPARGWHELKVKLRGRRGTVRARRGYFAGP